MHAGHGPGKKKHPPRAPEAFTNFIKCVVKNVGGCKNQQLTENRAPADSKISIDFIYRYPIIHEWMMETMELKKWNEIKVQ